MYTAEDFVDISEAKDKADFVNAFINFIDSGFKQSELTGQIVAAISKRRLFGHESDWQGSPESLWRMFFSDRCKIQSYFVFDSCTEWPDVEKVLVDYFNRPEVVAGRYTVEEDQFNSYLKLDGEIVFARSCVPKNNHFLNHLAELLNYFLSTKE